MGLTPKADVLWNVISRLFQTSSDPYLPDDGQTGRKCVGPGRLDQNLRTYDSLFPALMHAI
jgi:hypothetical protein